MSLKLPLVSCNKMANFLEKEGFVKLRQTGSHAFFKHPDGRTTIVPIHNNQELGRGLLKAILEEFNLSEYKVIAELLPILNNISMFTDIFIMKTILKKYINTN